MGRLKRLEKTECVREDITYEIEEEPLEEVIGFLQGTLETYKDRYKKLYLEKDYYGYDGGYELRLMGLRDETDEEYEQRKEERRRAREKADKESKAYKAKIKKEAERLGLL